MSYSLTPKATLFLLVILTLTLIESAVSVSLTKRHIPGRVPGRPRKLEGGFSPIDVDDPDVKEIAEFATSAISESSNSRPLTLIKIVKAESQVVAGRNYKLILELSSVVDGASETEETLCEVVVFHQPWTQTRKLSKSNCLPIKVIHSWTETRELGASVNCQKAQTEAVPDTPMMIVGGFSPIDTDDASVKEMADFATTRISESSNSGPLALIKVVKAESQVVAGKNYKLTLELGSATDGAVGSNLICNVLVFHQSWTHTLELKQSSCLAPIEAETDIVTEILRAIDGREDLSRIAGYLNASRETLIKEFPLTSSDGRKLGYTLFAPTSMAFMMQMPQDAGDPLVMDTDFRRSVLIRHFVREEVSSDDLGKLDKLIMADSNEVIFTRKSANELCNLPPIDNDGTECEANIPAWTFQPNSGKCENYVYGGCFKTKNLFETEEECQAACDPAVHPLTQLINETEVQQVAIQLEKDLGTIYVIDRVFMSGDEVGEILRKHPSPGFGFLGLLPIEIQPAVNENIPGRITGGFSSIDVNDAYIKEIADFATTAISANNNSGPVRLNRIIKAESQIVAGKNFKLTLQLNSAIDEADSLLCDVVIFEQSWSTGAQARQLKQSNCLSINTVVLWNQILKQENDSLPSLRVTELHSLF